MRFFAVILLTIAVASAEPTNTPASIIGQILEAIAALKPEPIAVGPAIVDTEPISVGPAIVDSEHEPISVGPAIVDSEHEPISVGPAIVDSEHEPISVGPAIVDFPLPDGGAVSESVVAPSPVAIIPGPVADVSASNPLVQIVVNINQAAESSPIVVAPVDSIAPEIKPEPVHVVDSAPEPVHVVEAAPEPVHVVEVAPEPVQVVEVAPEPVQVVEVAPEPSPIVNPIAVNPIGVVAPEVEPVQIGFPVIPEAAVVLPEELN